MQKSQISWTADQRDNVIAVNDFRSGMGLTQHIAYLLTPVVRASFNKFIDDRVFCSFAYSSWLSTSNSVLKTSSTHVDVLRQYCCKNGTQMIRRL